MKKFYILNLVLLLLITNLTAQSVCQEQLEINNEASGNKIGQSIFMSGCNGFFSSIELDRSDDGSELIAELNIFSGQTFLGTPLYTQSVTIPQTTGPFTIDFGSGTGDLSFFQDSQYTFMLSSSTLQLDSSSNIDSYSDGQMFIDVGFINNDDLWFKLSTTSTLGIENHEQKNLSLFPNPANDYIRLSGINTQDIFIIFDIIGSKLMSGIVSENEIIDIQNLPKGMYFLKLNNRETFKFVKK